MDEELEDRCPRASQGHFMCIECWEKTHPGVKANFWKAFQALTIATVRDQPTSGRRSAFDLAAHNAVYYNCRRLKEESGYGKP